MECVEALEAGFGKEMVMKSSPQVCLDEFWSSNAQNVASCDEFFVDELLDFSNGDVFVEEEPECEEEFKDSFSSVSVSPQKHQESHETSNQSSTSCPKHDFWSVSSRDFEELEWLSHLVADPLQEYSAPTIPTDFPTEKLNNRDETRPVAGIGISSVQSYLKTRFPSKPRSKRARICGRLWSLGFPFLSDMSSSLITSSSSCSSASSPWLNYHRPLKPAAKKPRKKSTVEGTGGVQSARRCSHCGVQKTPQWRAGPHGAKTLCNACGVRFKSGRLFPEYRPACSPTFSSELHSNHHRKVLEMRRKKETENQFSGSA